VRPLITHVAVRTTSFAPAALFLVNPLWLVWPVGTRLLLDGTGFVHWWALTAKRVLERDLRGPAW
jgi:hypothetical protein